MKKILPLVLTLLFPAAALAQSAAPAPSIVPIGHPFGSVDQWQFVVDKNAATGGCFEWLFRAHVAAAGGCVDPLILQREGTDFLHFGGQALYTPARSPYYSARFGLNIGPAAAAAGAWLGKGIPFVESLSNWTPPTWLSYAGNITSVDGSMGAYNGKLDGGAGIKIAAPIGDVCKALGWGWCS